MDPKDLAKVAEFAKEYNLTVETSSAERRTVQLSGSVEQMNQAFGVQLSNFEYSGGTYRSREGHVLVPRALSDVVKRVSGLTNRPLAQPHVEFRPLVVTESTPFRSARSTTSLRGQRGRDLHRDHRAWRRVHPAGLTCTSLPSRSARRTSSRSASTGR